MSYYVTGQRDKWQYWETDRQTIGSCGQ